MRLTPEQTHLIKRIIEREFDSGARVWLFGSRANDTRRGGDVDLYVESSHSDLMRELRCKVDLEDALDLRVDLIAAAPGDTRPIARIAKTQGILL